MEAEDSVLMPQCVSMPEESVLELFLSFHHACSLDDTYFLSLFSTKSSHGADIKCDILKIIIVTVWNVSLYI